MTYPSRPAAIDPSINEVFMLQLGLHEWLPQDTQIQEMNRTNIEKFNPKWKYWNSDKLQCQLPMSSLRGDRNLAYMTGGTSAQNNVPPLKSRPWDTRGREPVTRESTKIGPKEFWGVE